MAMLIPKLRGKFNHLKSKATSIGELFLKRGIIYKIVIFVVAGGAAAVIVIVV